MINLLRMSCLAAAMTVAISLPAAFADAGKPYGTWTMGKVTVKVRDCGGKLCGAIVALKEPISKIDGKPKVDRENPDATKRTRPLIGVSVLLGMKPSGEGKWTGSIYNPDDGKTYSASVTLNGDKLKVTGCVAAMSTLPAPCVRSATASLAMVPPVVMMSSTTTQSRPFTSPDTAIISTSSSLERRL